MKVPQGGSFRSTDDLDAYDDFLRGQTYSWRITKEDNKKARKMFENALKRDPQFGEAYALMGWAYLSAFWNQWSDNAQADLARSFEMAHKALAVDESNSDALELLSYVDWMLRRFDQAVADAKRAVAINPNSALGYLALSNALNGEEKPEEALRTSEKAMRLDPARQDFYAYSAGIAYNEMGHFQEAIPLFKRNLAAYPNNLSSHVGLLFAYAELGRDQDARAEGAEIMRISPQFKAASLLRGKWDDAISKRFERALRIAGLK
jgi:adenylate cyclase